MKRHFLLLLSIAVVSHLFAYDNEKALLEYTENKGQWEKPVLFKSDLHGGWVFVEKNELTYLFMEQTDHHHEQGKYLEQDGKKIPNPAYQEKAEEHVIKGHVYKTKWLNANTATMVTGSDKLDAYSNYFIGNDAAKWTSNVAAYRKIRYNNLYHNIDLLVYSVATSMKSDYILHKDARLDDIRVLYDGVDAIRIEENGNLKITTSINVINEYKPYAYQVINGKKVEVACNYALSGRILSFDCPDGYNKAYDLIIDPTLVFSTYSGSPVDNWGSSATHDASGNMFLGGISLASGYPTSTGAFQTTYGGGTTDVVITKFNSTGTSRIYSTYLGGSSNEILTSLNSTSSNELVCLISTSSTNFPTSANGYDKTHNGGSSTGAIANDIPFPNGSDIAVVKLNAAGSALVGATYFGGSGQDGLNRASNLEFNYGDDSRGDIAFDNAGNIYIVSTTSSTNIPGTAGKAQASNAGSYDGVVAKFNSTLSSLSWATYYGGSGQDAAYSMSLDNAGHILICGGTTSSNLPGTANGLNSTYRGGDADGFVAKFDNNGNGVLASTYLGTDSYDQAYLMDLDKNDNVYLFGQTTGAYPVTSGVYSNAGAKQFIHKLNNNLNATSFSTVFGRTNYSLVNISPTAFLVDICGNIYASGWGGSINSDFQFDAGTTNSMPVTSDGYKRTTDGNDFYLINLSTNAASLIYATYFGENGGIGDHVDGGTSRFDKTGVVYQAVCASCGSTNGFPTTTGAYSANNNSDNCNMAGFKFKFDLLGLQIVTTSATPSSGCAPLSTTFSYTATSPGTGYFWDFGDGTTSTTQFPSHTYNNPGTYTVRFILSDPSNCNPTDSSTLTITVVPKKTTTLNRTICQGQSVTVGNQTFSTNGTFNVTLQSSQGCDSTVTLNLTVNPTKAVTRNEALCPGESVTIGNQTFSTQGTFTIRLQTSLGCDSTITLNVTLNPDKTTTLNRTVCQGQSVTVGNQTFSTSGTFTVSLQSSQGCDSIVTLNLVVNPTKTTTLSQTICQGQSVTVGNQTFSTQGTYTVRLLTSLGCDSTVTLNLTVTTRIINNLTRAVCTGESVTVGNHIYSQTGNYSDTLRSAFGCDSIVNLSLTVNPDRATTLDRTICEGQSVTVGTQQFTTTGTFVVPLTTTAGCDSIVTLNLVVNPVKTTRLSSTICQGDSVTVGSQTFNSTGIYTVSLQTSLGCDSTVTLNLRVNPSYPTTITQGICNGFSVTYGNQSFDTEGTYVIPLQTTLGCDSTITLNLSVVNEFVTNLDITICQGETYTVLDNSYSESGTYTDTTAAIAGGCDSIIRLNLKVISVTRETVSRSICQGDTVSIGNNTYSEAGQYIDTVRSVQGCDSSILILNLTVNPLPAINATADKEVALPAEPIQLNVETEEALSYNWLPVANVNDNTLKNPIGTITAPTWFVVTATNGQTNCSTTDSVLVNLGRIFCTKDNIFVPNAFTPNGDGINDTFIARAPEFVTYQLIVYDRWGNKVFESTEQTKGWNGEYKGSPAPAEVYGYYFTGSCEEGGVITKKGNVTLIR